jgi:hypothetical protein
MTRFIVLYTERLRKTSEDGSSWNRLEAGNWFLGWVILQTWGVKRVFSSQKSIDFHGITWHIPEGRTFLKILSNWQLQYMSIYAVYVHMYMYTQIKGPKSNRLFPFKLAAKFPLGVQGLTTQVLQCRSDTCSTNEIKTHTQISWDRHNQHVLLVTNSDPLHCNVWPIYA